MRETVGGPLNGYLDLPPGDSRWGHRFESTEPGLRLHFVRKGSGQPVVLLHGWPGFWYDWRRIIPGLSRLADVIAPDFRGFGESDRPALEPAEGYTPDVLADDLLRLLDRLELNLKPILVAHDFGVTVAQTLVRKAPDRFQSLVLLNPPYAGIGMRRFDPASQKEFWYQHFHQLSLCEELVGLSEQTIEIYLRYFYSHWCGIKSAIRPEELKEIVKTYSKPGAFRSSILYYRARAAKRISEASSHEIHPVTHKTIVLWGKADPLIPWEWSDRIGEYFPESEVRLLSDVGHFVPLEAPKEVIQAIRSVMPPV